MYIWNINLHVLRFILKESELYPKPLIKKKKKNLRLSALIKKILWIFCCLFDKPNWKNLVKFLIKVWFWHFCIKMHHLNRNWCQYQIFSCFLIFFIKLFELINLFSQFILPNVTLIISKFLNIFFSYFYASVMKKKSMFFHS